MKIMILDRASLGRDTPLDMLNSVGQVEIYESTTHDEALLRVREAEVIIINKVKMTADIIRSAKNLRLICVFATGYDNIDLTAARECGVAVCNVPGYSSDSVALFTVSTVLSLVTHLSEYNKFVRSGEYLSAGVPNRLIPVYHELKGKTWGIVGYGGIGRAVAKVAEAFGSRVIINKRSPIDGVECVDIDTLCRESDIISLHCPLNDKTRGMINSERIALMKNTVILVNEARGAVVNEADVADAIKAGKIAGYGCDVYSTEPFSKDHPYSSIMNMDNVILTPHAAWGAYEARVRCLSIIVDNIKAFIDGKTLNRVDI